MFLFDPMDYVAKKDLHGENTVYCWDVRKFWEAFPEELIPYIWDVKLLYNSYPSLEKVALANLEENEGEYLNYLRNKVKAQLKASQHFKIASWRKLPIHRIVEPTIWDKYIAQRAFAITHLIESKSFVKNAALISDRKEYKGLLDLVKALSIIEEAGIFFSKEKVNYLYCSKDDIKEHTFAKKVLKQKNPYGQFVNLRYNPSPGLTGRLGIESGFDPHTIPHGVCREVFESRYYHGEIVVFDFNAMDFRSLIFMAQDEKLNEIYNQDEDFHAITAELMFGNKSLRKIVKNLCYALLYGGSLETIAQKAELSVLETSQLVERFWNKLNSLKVLKEKFEDSAKNTGYLTIPMLGKIVKVPEPRKALAYAGQSLSSFVFARGIKKAAYKAQNYKLSRLIFTVHDELVADVHPEEAAEFVKEMQSCLVDPYWGFKYKLKTRRGKNYEEATR